LYASVHYFKAIAYDNCGDTASSEVIKIKTTFPTCQDGYWNGNEKGKDCGGDCPACPTPCTVPTYLSASVYGSDVTLTWNGTAALYFLEIVNTETYQIVVSTFATSPYHISLTDGSYKFRVKSKCGYETSEWSYYKYFVVDDYHPTCYEPHNLSYSINGSNVTLTWTGNVSEYHLEVKNTSTNVIIVSDLHATSPYHLYNLPDGYYAFKVKSICYPHYSDWSSSVTFAIHDYHPNPQPCYTPTQLTSNVFGDEVHLSWNGNASQYQVQIEDADTHNSIVSIYLDNTYFKTTLAHGDYRWRVRCVCHGDYSDWSSWNNFSIHYYPGLLRAILRIIFLPRCIPMKSI
jgi:hypothetical protein